MKIIKSHEKQNLFNSLIKKKFSVKKEYANLTPFDPEAETSKFYKIYLPTMTKQYIENLKIQKFDMINNILKKNKSLTYIAAGAYNLLKLNDDLISLFKIIIKIAQADEKNLQEVSEYYFKHEGKGIRPKTLILISKYIYECKYNTSNFFESDHEYTKLFAACVEILHNASLLHDDIIDNSDKRRNSITAHNLFGIRNTVYGANFLISKSASVLAELDIGQLNEIYSEMVNNLTYGEVQQSLKNPDLDNLEHSFYVYMVKTYYKTASLISLSLRGVALIYELDESIQRDLFNLGLHIGMVFQLIDDVLDVTIDTAKMKKPAFKDIQEGVINSYILYEIADMKEGVIDMAKRKFKGKDDIKNIKLAIEEGCGVLKTINLAMDHLLEAFTILNNNPFFIENNTKYIILEYFYKLINRQY